MAQSGVRKTGKKTLDATPDEVGKGRAKPVKRPAFDSVPPASRRGARVLDLAPNHKAVKAYYAELARFTEFEATHEGAVRDAFGSVLKSCASQFGWTLIGEFPHVRKGRYPAKVDGALVNKWGIPRAYWEAKDSDDDLDREIKKKIAEGYPVDNIVFQAPDRAVVFQNGRRLCDEDITKPQALVDVLKLLFQYEAPRIEEWERAADEFGDKVPELARALTKIIIEERKRNRKFVEAFAGFCEMCRRAINPNIGDDAIQRMLVQHLLTERIFRKVFDNPDFAQRNVIAVEIEKVIGALTSRAFNRDQFLSSLERFYGALERTAASFDDYTQKQSFLNRVYERFFQGFDEKSADAYGIVYTPQSIVKFMTQSVDELLRAEFGKRLGASGVHIIDPFVGTGNFLLHVMRALPKADLARKYQGELHANEIMLLPYYIASMNIEHEYAELTNQYEAFEGLCLVDTFELAEPKQHELAFMSETNSKRVHKQKNAPIFVIIGNPPYNAWQVNENDNNKNRKYKVLDRRVTDTYGKASSARLLSSLQDPYIKAIRWASDRIGDDGIVAFVTNSGFVDGLACDGMRKHLGSDFDAIYVLDLGGNVRKNPKLSGTTHNVFGIQVGVCINFFVRRKKSKGASRAGKIFHARVDEWWRREQKYEFLDAAASIRGVEWTEITPNAAGSWLTTGEDDDFYLHMPIAAKGRITAQAKGVVFSLCSNGVKSQRDAVVYNFDRATLAENAKQFCVSYESERHRFVGSGSPKDMDSFVDPEKLKWSRNLKRELARARPLRFNKANICAAQYRPFTRSWLYLADIAIDEPGKMMNFFPPGAENAAIWLKTGAEVPLFALGVRTVPDLLPQGGSQCFPFYVYDDDGARRENITDWCLQEFREHYKNPEISKWQIFYYVYAMLHHPMYRARYVGNLKRELPRLPYATNFGLFAADGQRLFELHADYETQKEWPLERVEAPGVPLDWRTERMRLSGDKRSIVYNEFLTLGGIPEDAFAYRLGNRSALEWVLDQYRCSNDAQTGTSNDPNQLDDEEYIVRLLGQVVTVSIETMKIIRALPPLDPAARPASIPAKPYEIPSAPVLRAAETVTLGKRLREN